MPLCMTIYDRRLLSHVIQLVQLMVQLMVQLLVQLNYIIISYLYIGTRCLSEFITFGSHLALCQCDNF
jgi:hypothetical protein